MLVAFLAPWKDRLNVWVRPLLSGADDNKPRRLTADQTRNIDGFWWTLDSKHILFVQDTKGDENWHLQHQTCLTTGRWFMSLQELKPVRFS